MYVCIYLYLFTNTGLILNSESMGAFLVAHFLEKEHFACSHSLSRCDFQPFLTNFFFKTQDNGLGAIVAPSKCLEQALE